MPTVLLSCVLLLLVPIATPAATLEEMLGQMLVVGFRGTHLEAGHPLFEDIRTRHLGGVILFSRDVQLGSPRRNIESPHQLRALTTSLQEQSSTPLFVAIDQEGGRVSRLGPECGFPATPSAKDMGAESIEATRAVGARTGALLASLGINVDFAPVVDVDVASQSPAIGALERSFSSDPKRVAEHAGAFCEGLLSAGVLPCLKHFPGHGSALTDSHLGITDITGTWDAQELLPYQILIPRRLPCMIMTGHLFLRQFDPDYPATLSPLIVTSLLRHQLQYDGLVVSDDMQMRAITNHYGFAEAVVRAVNAGVDILVFGNNLDHDQKIVAKTVDILKTAVEDGRIPRERILRAYERIQATKSKLNIPTTS